MQQQGTPIMDFLDEMAEDNIGLFRPANDVSDTPVQRNISDFLADNITPLPPRRPRGEIIVEGETRERPIRHPNISQTEPSLDLDKLLDSL